MILMKRLFAVVIAALAVAGTASAQQPGGATGQPSPQDRMAQAKASMKTAFGFTDAQATAALEKAKAVGNQYKPRMMALQANLQKKYGATPTPEQQKAAVREMMPLYMEMVKKTNAAVLSVATPAQRPKIEAQFKANADRMKKASGG